MNKSEIKLVEKTLKLLNKKSWNKITYNEVIKGFSNSSIKIKNKNDLLKKVNSYVDYTLKIKMKNLEKSTQKDMIFEVIMARFDILQKYRKSFINIYNFFKSNPHNSLLISKAFLESMILISNLADLKIKGIRGRIMIKGLFVIYICTFLIWKQDNTKELEKTMTYLDKYLEYAEKLMNNIL